MADRREAVTGTDETLPGTSAPSGPPSGAASGRTQDLPVVPSYDVIGRLGAGGFGEVFRARHAVIGREVAIKILHAKYSGDAAAVARFVAEARAVNRVSHPGIVEIFDFGQLEDGRQYCVMELLRGVTLRDVLRERGKLSLDDAMWILRGIAEAVDAAHAAGVAHRDLKPENVFVLDDRSIKLIDFGLAKLTATDAPVTETGSVMGTPLYMSPEQCRGRGVDTRTDAYSFGALAYHVLVGEPPFAGDAIELALHHLNDDPTPPSRRDPALSDRVDRVLLALLAKEPAQRPSKLVPAVEALVGEAPLPSRPRRRRARWPWLVVGGGTLVAAGAVVAIVLGRGATRSGGDACPLAREQLAGAWDPALRAKLAAMFAAKEKEPNVAASWRVAVSALDSFATRWGEQWESACRSDDKRRDPLLYAQRIACLEDALVELRGATSALSTIEVVSWSKSFTGNFWLPDLDDCLSIPVLRAQVPPPPEEHRAEHVQLREEIQRGRAQVRRSINGGQHDELADGLARLEKVAARLEALGSPAAASALFWRSHYLLRLAGQTDVSRTAAERRRAAASIDETIRVAGRLRQEPMLIGAYNLRITMDLDDGVAASQIEATLELARAALVRAGTPPTSKVVVDMAQARLDLREGRIENALALHRAATPLYERWAGVVDGSNPRRSIPRLLHRLGRHSEALAEAEQTVAMSVRTFGESHQIVDTLRSELATSRELAGDLEGAYTLWERQLVGPQVHDPRYVRFVRTRMLELALRRHRSDLVEAGDKSLAHEPIEDLITMALDYGQLALLDHLRKQLPRRVTRLSPAGIDEGLLLLAFFLGDDEALERHARRIPPHEPLKSAPTWLTDWSHAPWFVAVADARRGNVRAARAALASLARYRDASELMTRANALVNEGFVLVELGDWKSARRNYEQARALPVWPNHVWFKADIDAWLGIARYRDGDVAAAIPMLEESLDVLTGCCAQAHYFAPMAQLTLARALWETDKDRPRARRLAEQARAIAARMPHRADEAAEAARWLAEHPP